MLCENVLFNLNLSKPLKHSFLTNILIPPQFTQHLSLPHKLSFYNTFLIKSCWISFQNKPIPNKKFFKTRFYKLHVFTSLYRALSVEISSCSKSLPQKAFFKNIPLPTFHIQVAISICLLWKVWKEFLLYMFPSKYSRNHAFVISVTKIWKHDAYKHNKTSFYSVTLARRCFPQSLVVRSFVVQSFNGMFGLSSLLIIWEQRTSDAAKNY